jgi:hypothetical protein
MVARDGPVFVVIQIRIVRKAVVERLTVEVWID